MRTSNSGYFSNDDNNKSINIICSSKGTKNFLSRTRKINFNTKKEKNTNFNGDSCIFNDRNEAKKVNIKFSLLNNYKKYNTIFNNKGYKKIIEFNEENLSLNNKLRNNTLIKNNHFVPKSIKSKNKNKKIQYSNDNINKDVEINGQDPHNYFPDDFSLKIFKSTYIYKKRFKIQAWRLKKVLQKIYNIENSKIFEKLIALIKKRIKDNKLSDEMIHNLKLNKIDKFVNEYLNINSPNNSPKDKEFINSYNKKIEKLFITDKYCEDKKVNFIIPDDANMNNINIKYPESNIIKENKKRINNFMLKNVNMKEHTKNTGTQTINIIEKNNINSFNNINKSEFRYCNDQNCFQINNKYLNNKKPLSKHNYYKLKKRTEIEKMRNKKNFFRKHPRPFSSANIKENISSMNLRKNFINNNNQNKNIIYSFYNPKDKTIQLFNKFEKRILD
jgi:hypothetical protein